MNNKLSSSFYSKSCYRLYAGHSNWISLDAKTTQDLIKIFQKGEPCRYQLEPGLFIDIIPNDVDCNSKNIDMIGLMRADLVYDSPHSENQVQQQMSHYVRSLLDDQGIIDAFPPLRKGEELPSITSIPTHRHLSLVPSVIGSVRRGPKSNQMQSHSLNTSKNPSSASSVSGDNPSFSSSQGSFINNNRKKSNTSTKRMAKRTRQLDYDGSSKRQLITLGSPNLVNNSFMSHCPPMMNLKPFSNDDSHYHHHGQSMIPLDFHHNQQQHQHQQHQEDPQGDSNGFWTTTSTYQHSPLYSQARASSHGFSFGMDLDYAALQHPRQSPTDILNEYNNHGFPFNNESGMASYPSSMIPVTDSETGSSSKLVMSKQSTTNGHFISSDTNSLESFVPTSPIQNWLDDDKNNNNKQQNDGRWVSSEYNHQPKDEVVHEKSNAAVKSEEYHHFTENMTILPVIERLILQQDANHTTTTTTNNIMFSHANREENSHSSATTAMSSP